MTAKVPTKVRFQMGNSVGIDEMQVGEFVGIDHGGTGATTAADARTALGLGTIATQAATNVNIDGGTIDGTVIGGSSAAAGTFTSLATSAGITATGTTASSITVSSGTAVPLTITNAGTGNSFVVEDSASTDSTPFVIDASGNVFQGYGTNLAPSVVGTTPLQGNVVGSTTGNMALAQWSAVGSGSAQITLSHSLGGTTGTHTIVTNGTALGKIRSFGSDGTQFVEAASIESYVDGTPGLNDMPGRLVFSTTADGASSPTERMRIDSSGNVQVRSGTLGYGTGVGGTVTQATSRTTGVTLNKISGAITLVSAAGTTSWQTFTVTNSTVAATDTVIVNQKSGTDLNMIHVTAVASGSFNISFATTGGTTTEQPVFNFNVIKGVTS